MKIMKVLTSAGLTGFYTDDIHAIRSGAPHDGFFYQGKPLTKGFKAIRQPGESVSIMLVLEDGIICYGDCASTQYSGSTGRGMPFSSSLAISYIKEHIIPILEGYKLQSFLEISKKIDDFSVNGEPIPRAIAYGVTQALLEAVAVSQRKTMTEVLVDEYGLNLVVEPVPIYAQTGDERYTNVDKMILKGVDIIPHGLFNNVEELVGKDGGKLLEYVKWLKNRINKYGNKNYHPIIHLDVYGTIGMAFDNNLEKVSDYLLKLENELDTFPLIVEMPVEMRSREEQIEAMLILKAQIKKNSGNVRVMVDEWCNSIDDVKVWVAKKATDVINVKTLVLGALHNIVDTILLCKKNGVGTLMGGSCNETDKSGQIRVHLALAARPDAIAAVPGMGVDEGLMIIKNEMNRTLSILESKKMD